MAFKKSISGSRAKVYLNGVEIGFAVGISATETDTLTRVDTMGSAFTKEIVRQRRIAQCNISFVRIYQGSAKQMGFMPRGSTAEILSFPDVEIVLWDNVENKPLETIEGAVCEQRTWNVDAGGIFSSNVSMQAIRIRDEGEQ